MMPPEKDAKSPRSPHTPPPRVGRLNTVADIRVELARVYRAARTRKLELIDAKGLAYILVSLGALIRDSALEQRVEQLETAAVAQAPHP